MVDLKQALSDARLRLEQAESEHAELEARIARLHDEVRGLELALAHHGGGEIEVLTRKTGWGRISRTKAILNLLQEVGRPMGPSEIAAQLRERGRVKENPRYISASLAYLKNNHVVRSVGNGKWQLMEVPKNQSSGVGPLGPAFETARARPEGG